MNLTIITQSYTLCGSGEGTGVIDADVVYDDHGIPYIPARRLKGLLRESATEVCEYLGIGVQIIDELFGANGLKGGKIKITNCFIPDYRAVDFSIHNLRQPFKSILSKNRITAYFTEIRQQTAIGKDGTAQEHSLRTYRVIKPNMTFVGEIIIDSLNRSEKGLMFLSALNLTRMGTRRNRGFGKVKCSVGLNEFSHSADAIEALRNHSGDEAPQLSIEGRPSAAMPEEPIDIKVEPRRMFCTVKTLSSVIFGRQKGDQNTVSSENHIPNTAMRGIIATRYIRSRNLDVTYRDYYFDQIFLKGKVIISSAYPVSDEKTFYPSPLALRERKGTVSGEIVNVLAEPIKDKSKSVEGMVAIDASKVTIKKVERTAFFHNSRDRIKGHSTGDGIFYYESLDAGQEFSACLIGPKSLLTNLREALGESYTIEVGKSKTAQYGSVEVHVGDIEEIEGHEISLPGKSFVMNAITPIILYNDHGFCEISSDRLGKYLSATLGVGVHVAHAEAAHDFVETYVSVWHSKSQREYAYAAGSSFEIELEDNEPNNSLLANLKRLETDGIGEAKEFGFGRVKVNWISEKSYTKSVSSSTETKSLEPEPPEFKKMLKEILSSALMKEIENMSYSRARKYKRKLKSHLVSRLEGMIEESSSRKSFEEKLNLLEGKPAWKVLGDAGLLKELKGSFVDGEISHAIEKLFHDNVSLQPAVDRESLSKSYWLYFFKSLRKINKETADEKS
jgi:CRISPR-associated protein Csx10